MDMPTIEAAIEREYIKRDSNQYTKRRWGLGAFKAGWLAAQNGQPPEDCPYKDIRTGDNRITFARAFIKKWHRGYTAYYAMWREYCPNGHLP